MILILRESLASERLLLLLPILNNANLIFALFYIPMLTREVRRLEVEYEKVRVGRF